MTRLARGAAGASVAKVASSYVRAHGGARAATTAAFSGRSAVSSLGTFLGSGLARGFSEAVRSLGIDPFLGRSADALLVEIVDHLAPAGSTIEEAAAREAMVRSISEIFDQCDVSTDGVSGLDQLTPEDAQRVIQVTVANYIQQRILQDLFYRVEQTLIDVRRADQWCAEIREFVRALVVHDIGQLDLRRIEFASPAWRAIVNRLFLDAYSLIEAAP
jgi:hypothetical protein